MSDGLVWVGGLVSREGSVIFLALQKRCLLGFSRIGISRRCASVQILVTVMSGSRGCSWGVGLCSRVGLRCRLGYILVFPKFFHLYFCYVFHHFVDAVMSFWVVIDFCIGFQVLFYALFSGFAVAAWIKNLFFCCINHDC